MTEAICISGLRGMFAEAAAQIRREQALLTRLDSIGGDGDHGATMVRAVDRIESELSAANEKPLHQRLKEAGWGVLSVDGGASSALLGTFVAGLGDADLGQQSDCKQLAAGLAAGLQAVEKRTKARPGDKTMMDALVPAVDAFTSAAHEGASIRRAMQLAAEAARAGADATRNMQAKYGRAKFVGERTLGSPDAGATSIALLFEGFSSALAKQKEDSHG